MTQAVEVPTGAPLTVLSEEEQMFQQSVRDFAIEKVRPLVHQRAVLAGSAYGHRLLHAQSGQCAPRDG